MPLPIYSTPRPGLDLHRRSHSSAPSPLAPKIPFAPLPISIIRAPSLSDIPEERTPRTTGTSSHIKSLDGNMSTPSDLEAQLGSRWRPRLLALKPGFRNPPPFKSWLRHSWLDILTQLLCLLASGTIYLFATPLLPRYFPLYRGVHTSAWGVAHGQPFLPEYITTLASAVISFVVPWVVIGAIGLWNVRDFWESHAALMGLGYALATATLFQAFIKWIIGGLRPHFLAVCNPHIPPSRLGLDPNAMWYTASICTGDRKLVKEAQMSFPSGHSCAAFAGFGFLALYLNSKLKIVGRKQNDALPTAANEDDKTGGGIYGARVTQHWKLVVWVLPWLLALLMAASKVRDGWHHPIDVLFGSLVGIAFAHMAFHCAFEGVYDGKMNHLPRH